MDARWDREVERERLRNERERELLRKLREYHNE